MELLAVFLTTGKLDVKGDQHVRHGAALCLFNLLQLQDGTRHYIFDTNLVNIDVIVSCCRWKGGALADAALALLVRCVACLVGRDVPCQKATEIVKGFIDCDTVDVRLACVELAAKISDWKSLLWVVDTETE
eukprot:gnl/Chilomastix_caulleri/4593.p1 GENE.gnl/Chilomastix_caulleri/4593~~gnl/Chilomastix_caulleri/4593.p1  ORF type:complete len:132 (-),score=26.54 gnl/Chilomastix_caulleri/4593:108-503(-)